MSPSYEVTGQSIRDLYDNIGANSSSPKLVTVRGKVMNESAIDLLIRLKSLPECKSVAWDSTEEWNLEVIVRSPGPIRLEAWLKKHLSPRIHQEILEFEVVDRPVLSSKTMCP